MEEAVNKYDEQKAVLWVNLRKCRRRHFARKYVPIKNFVWCLAVQISRLIIKQLCALLAEVQNSIPYSVCRGTKVRYLSFEAAELSCRDKIEHCVQFTVEMCIVQCTVQSM